jgi:hypothetical protein
MNWTHLNSHLPARRLPCLEVTPNLAMTIFGSSRSGHASDLNSNKKPQYSPISLMRSSEQRKIPFYLSPTSVVQMYFRD